MVIKKSFAILVFIFAIGIALNAQNKVEQIDSLISYCYKNGMFNGSILIAEKGKIIFHNSYGYSNLEDKSKLNQNTPFYIASIAKQLTAMGIMILAEENKLSYTDNLKQYFSDLPDYIEPVTIRSLLNHTSGIKDHYRTIKDQDGLTNLDVLKSLNQGDSLLFKFNSKFRYSNSGYCLLAMIIEKVSGESYKNFMDKNIFIPLGMTNTFVLDSIYRNKKNKAIGYDRFGNKSDYNKLSYGAGGIYSTVEDLFRWSQALNTEILVSETSLSESFKPGISNSGEVINYYRKADTVSYGFGWILHRNSMNGIYSHSGGYNGFKNIIVKDKIKDIEIIFLTNNGWTCPIFELQNELLNIMNGRAFNMPKVPIGIALHKKYVQDNSINLYLTYNEIKNKSIEKYAFSESELTYLGYHFLKKNQLENAKLIFNLNIREYPNSWNTYDCYAEACYKNGEIDLALTNYQKSLNLNPENMNAVKMIKKIKK